MILFADFYMCGLPSTPTLNTVPCSLLLPTTPAYICKLPLGCGGGGPAGANKLQPIYNVRGWSDWPRIVFRVGVDGSPHIEKSAMRINWSKRVFSKLVL